MTRVRLRIILAAFLIGLTATLAHGVARAQSPATPGPASRDPIDVAEDRPTLR